MKIDYEIKNEKIIFNKEGVYFSVPVEQIDEFLRIVNVARTQYLRNETREETEAFYGLAVSSRPVINYLEEAAKKLTDKQKRDLALVSGRAALENYNE